MNKRSYQVGFSLIELMITMLIGLFMIGGIISVFISSSQNYRVQRALSEVQDKGRFAIQKLREDIHSAGFELANDKIAVKFITVAGASSCSGNRPTLLIYIADGTDTLRRCYYLDPASRSLIRDDAIGTAAPSVGTAVVIAEDVDQITYSFAVDKDSNGGEIDIVNNLIYQPVVSFGVVAGVEWLNVKAVKIELIVSSTTEQVADPAQIIIDPFNNGTPFEATDSRLHQAYTAIVPIKNRI